MPAGATGIRMHPFTRARANPKTCGLRWKLTTWIVGGAPGEPRSWTGPVPLLGIIALFPPASRTDAHERFHCLHRRGGTLIMSAFP